MEIALKLREVGKNMRNTCYNEWKHSLEQNDFSRLFDIYH